MATAPCQFDRATTGQPAGSQNRREREMKCIGREGDRSRTSIARGAMIPCKCFNVHLAHWLAFVVCLFFNLDSSHVQRLPYVPPCCIVRLLLTFFQHHKATRPTCLLPPAPRKASVHPCPECPCQRFRHSNLIRAHQHRIQDSDLECHRLLHHRMAYRRRSQGRACRRMQMASGQPRAWDTMEAPAWGILLVVDTGLTRAPWAYHVRRT